jgi:hypothetical protein
MEEEQVLWNGYYREDGKHVCRCGVLTRYQILSGGREFFCEACGTNGIYPEGDGGPRARLLDQGPDGIALLRAQMDQEIARRKDKKSSI